MLLKQLGAVACSSTLSTLLPKWKAHVPLELMDSQQTGLESLKLVTLYAINEICRD